MQQGQFNTLGEAMLSLGVKNYIVLREDCCPTLKNRKPEIEKVLAIQSKNKIRLVTQCVDKTFNIIG